MMLLKLALLKACKISVVIPVSNSQFLEDALKSLARQHRQPDEVVLVPDGLKLEVIDNFGLNLRILEPASCSMGPGGARNRGIAAALGEVIAFQDADDLSYSNRLEVAERHLLSGQFGLCCGAVDIIDFSGRRLATELDASFAFSQHAETNRIGTSGVSVRSEVLADVGGFDESLPSCEDYDLWLRIAERYEVAHDQSPIFAYRDWQASLTKQIDKSTTEKTLARVKEKRECRLRTREALR